MFSQKSTGPRRKQRRQEIRLDPDVPFYNASTLPYANFERRKHGYSLMNKSVMKQLLKPFGFTRISKVGYEIFARLLDEGVESALVKVQNIKANGKPTSTFGTSDHHVFFLKNYHGLATRKVPGNVVEGMVSYTNRMAESAKSRRNTMKSSTVKKIAMYKLLPPFIKRLYKDVKIVLKEKHYPVSNLSVADSMDYFKKTPGALEAAAGNYGVSTNVFPQISSKQNAITGNFLTMVLKWSEYNRHKAKRVRLPLTKAEEGWIYQNETAHGRVFFKSYYKALYSDTTDEEIRHMIANLNDAQKKTYDRLMKHLTIKNGLITVTSLPPVSSKSVPKKPTASTSGTGSAGGTGATKNEDEEMEDGNESSAGDRVQKFGEYWSLFLNGVYYSIPLTVMDEIMKTFQIDMTKNGVPKVEAIAELAKTNQLFRDTLEIYEE